MSLKFIGRVPVCRPFSMSVLSLGSDWGSRREHWQNGHQGFVTTCNLGGPLEVFLLFCYYCCCFFVCFCFNYGPRERSGKSILTALRSQPVTPKLSRILQPYTLSKPLVPVARYRVNRKLTNSRSLLWSDRSEPLIPSLSVREGRTKSTKWKKIKMWTVLVFVGVFRPLEET